MQIIFKALYDHVPYEVHVWQLVYNAAGRIKTWRLVDANAKALKSWNKARSDVVGKVTDEIFPHSDATAVFMPVIEKIFASNQPYEWEERFADTGQILRMISIPLDDIFISCGMDVSQYRDVEEELFQKSDELQRSLKRLRIATETAHVGIWEFDLKTDSLIWDKSMYQMYGVEPSVSQIPYETWSQGVHKDDVALATEELSRAIATTGAFESEFRIIREDNGEVRYIAAQGTTEYGPDGDPIRMVGVNFDQTERKLAENEIERLAYFDTLTGLANRSLIEDRLAQAVASSGRTRSHCALIFIDLDNFKAVNDSAGHAVGDELLIAVVERLQPSVRDGDTFGRFGGDELVIILNNLSVDALSAGKAAEAFALKISAAIREPSELSIGRYTTTASLGICLFSGAGLTNSEIMRQADLAMYRAKVSGKDSVRFFDPVMQSTLLKRVQLENDLQHAIDNNQFDLHYQPQFGAEGSVRGAEVLLRWTHAERGAISPAEFIPIAEESGKIREIGDWVINRALADLENKIGRVAVEGFMLAINVSAVQLYDTSFHEALTSRVLASGVRPEQIMIEITESALIEPGVDITEKMELLQSAGFRFSLDDFGTGYSSLTLLKQLPIAELKIDQSFVRDLPSDSDSLAIARSVIALAESMGLTAIAEGVETEAQKKLLDTMGCRYFQGYYFSRPLPIDGFLDFLRSASNPPHRVASAMRPLDSGRSSGRV